ncbi:hypothetical protein [Terrimonas alba]|uniref:hypothetical protein n=1 Tax=Terrimonas alba TaxID=3349636 RepID=UPI0035F4065C
MRKSFSVGSIEKIQLELADLDRGFVNIRGKKLKPSQCYRFDTGSGNILFNTNCPEGLKQKIQEIVMKYLNTPND